MVKHSMSAKWAVMMVALCGAADWGGSAAYAQTESQVPDNGLGTVSSATNGQGAISVCASTLSQGPETALLVVPSGTVFEAGATGEKAGGQAFVTTETVTLTKMQPCGMADASTLVSHTRHWLVNPVKAPASVLFHAVGEVSGNGLDTTFGDETSGLRVALKTGAITAHVQGRLHDTVYLTESEADIEDPDALQKP